MFLPNQIWFELKHCEMFWNIKTHSSNYPLCFETNVLFFAHKSFSFSKARLLLIPCNSFNCLCLCKVLAEISLGHFSNHITVMFEEWLCFCYFFIFFLKLTEKTHTRSQKKKNDDTSERYVFHRWQV